MEPLNQQIFSLFVKNNWTLSLAESCTGGKVAEMVVSVPDASRYFLGSIVAYSNTAKKELLHVSGETLEYFGAVSEEVADEMARGALMRFHSDFAIGVTGISGPSGGSPEKPVGMVCFAIASRERSVTWKSYFDGKRTMIMERAAEESLLRLWKILNP